MRMRESLCLSREGELQREAFTIEKTRRVGTDIMMNLL
jgi:hypothetical protein